MWFILLLVGLAAADSEPFKERQFEYFITNQNLHVDKLAHDLHELEEEFSKYSHDVDDKTVRLLKHRIHNLEGPHCPEHFSECGGLVPQCISDLFFCDGQKDCKNGGDESPQICSEAATHVGSSYTGIATWSGCEESAPHYAVVTITASERKDFFQSYVWVRGVLSFEVDEHIHTVRSYPLRGFYNFGSHVLLMGPERGTKPVYGARCKFNMGDFDHAECEIVNPESLHVCAHFFADRY